MEEPSVTLWDGFSEVVPASTFQPGRVDTEPIGTSTLRNPAIHRGVMRLFSTCIAGRLKLGLEVLTRVTGESVESYTCNPRPTPNRSQSLCSKALNPPDWNDFRIRMAA